jgi:hypothetical protein
MNRHAFSQKCIPGCTCGRHNRPKYGSNTTECEACGTKEGPFVQGYCPKHYQRFRRTGDPFGDGRRFNSVENTRNFWCVCSHYSDDHKGEKRTGSCRVKGCDCKKPTKVNLEYLNDCMRKIKGLGFFNHTAKLATCSQCLEPIQIGRWHEPETIKRALLHRRRDCPGLRKARAENSSPNRTNGVDYDYGQIRH